MMVLIAYDVSVETTAGRRRLRHVAKACSDYGQRVQASVFECILEPAQWERLRTTLVGIIEPETDSLRFYQLGANWRRRVQHVGRQISVDPEGPLIA